MSKPALICDTSLLLYLGRLGHENLQQNLFGPVCVPQTVSIELAAGRLLRPDTIDPRQLEWITSVSVSPSDIENLPDNRLGLGERSVIAYACAHPNCWVGLDDRQARLLAKSLGVRVIGTVGVIIKAKKAGLISSTKELLERAKGEGFRLNAEVYVEALRLAGEGGSTEE